MKKSILFVALLTFCFSLLTLNCNAQYGWSTVIDLYHYYINGGSIRALCNDAASNQLLIGGKHNITLTQTTGGGNCCDNCLQIFGSDIFSDEGCEAPIKNGTDTACILSLASVWDSTMSQDFYAIGGKFTDEWCVYMDCATDFHNLIINPADAPYIDDQYMSCSDTVFAVAMLDNKKTPTCANRNFKTYVAAKCAFCSCQYPPSIDSSRYIAFYDPYQGCNYSATVNYMQGGTNGPVYALRALDTANVYAGGRFDTAGVIKAYNIAKWNGSGWDSLGGGVNGVVKTLLTYNGKLYVGGNFTLAGGNTANNIAAWDGTNWSALGTGTNGTVNALTVYNGNLYVGGKFDSVGVIKVNNIAKWDGTNWSDVAGGRNAEVSALASFQGALYVGGKFSGGTNDTARYLAKYIDSTHVGITENSKPKTNISVYPNPVVDNLTIEIPQSAIIEITNIQGQLIKTFTTIGNKTNVDVLALPSGVYIVEVRTEKGVEVKKFIKE